LGETLRNETVGHERGGVVALVFGIANSMGAKTDIMRSIDSAITVFFENLIFTFFSPLMDLFSRGCLLIYCFVSVSSTDNQYFFSRISEKKDLPMIELLAKGSHLNR
jgi:hypothetical protein